MENYFGKEIAKNRLEVKDGEKLDLGGRSLTFVAAPMVHWPEVMVAYDDKDKILFSADAFGKFGRTLGRRSEKILYRNRRKVRRAGSVPSEKSRRARYRENLPPSRRSS